MSSVFSWAAATHGTSQAITTSHQPICFTVPPREMLECRMRIGFVVTGGFDRSARERVTPSLLWLVERLARRHDVHVFVLHYYPESRTYPLLGATVHDLGRVDGPRGLGRGRRRRRLASA